MVQQKVDVKTVCVEVDLAYRAQIDNDWANDKAMALLAYRPWVHIHFPPLLRRSM